VAGHGAVSHGGADDQFGGNSKFEGLWWLIGGEERCTGFVKS
jgi:hypothetical protein